MTLGKHWPIPEKIDLGSHLIHIVLLTRKEMKDFVDWEEGDDDVLGGWDVDSDTIAIGKWLTKKKQRWVLLHELIHAVIDYRDMYD